MNERLTDPEKTLVDAMASALSKSAPDVTENLDTPDPRTTLRTRVVAITWQGEEFIMLQCHGNTITLDIEAFQALERFAEQIGWRPQ